MSYTATSPLDGAPQATAEQARGFLLNRGADPELAAVLATEYWARATAAGLDPVLLVAQCAHETGALSSWWSRPPRRNLAGIGVTGASRPHVADGVPNWQPGDDGRDFEGFAFPDWAAAVLAHVVHLAAYRYAPGAEPLGIRPHMNEGADPRLPAMTGAGLRGKARVLGDLDGRWAVPGVGYGGRLAATANAILATGQTALVFGRVPHPPFERRIIDKPEGVGWDNRGRREIVGTCVHRMAGNLLGSEGHFKNRATGALTDYGIGGALDPAELDGVIFMWNEPEGHRTPWASGWGPGEKDIKGDGPAFIRAYTEAGINRNLASIELSGHMDTGVTDKQFESLCQLVAYWHDRARVPWHEFPRNPATGVVTQMHHREFSTKSCPGAVVVQRTLEYQDRVRAIMRAHQEGETMAFPFPFDDSPDPATWHCQLTDTWVVQPEFLAKYRQLGMHALEVFGLPILGQVDRVQYFERARFELQPDGTVALGLVGREAATAEGLLHV